MKLSAVVQLIDGFSLAPAVGMRPRFLLDGKPCQAYAKPQAFYAFSGLDDGSYRLTTITLPFFEREVAFDVPLRLPLADAIAPCVLEPSPLYPFPPGTTLIRGQVRAAGTRAPLAGVAVEASYAGRRGDTRHAATRTSHFGHYDGRYALALGGRLDAETTVTLVFDKAGYARTATQRVIRPGTTQLVDIELR
ncbi:hypothetical protein WL40_05030 [Burkholderia ubonensis]|uniref:Carboxypeptidase regulatory-like domain-containing protein n=1 Tax=Burkholderia ubonensis TaxID=101571 RepID=A0A105UW76_9BURK|nr:hypothetical protein [Burkholderia ubonensis]KVH81813.1 hypothetical protein WJ41_27385 [Burkholderia ubonensis]KVM17003.1 hypothetical protein WJ52_13000 [Burkholderia ubonensis]KVM18809.1 hypothetical protein WJ51_07085 [Burkholderia ubonensis]KVM42255.1 hypothetical protein WJ56_30705 [Burkholderia ubonensis]KVN85795.1 hypothetical protein WJ68_12360 [Burkholderia ubonensis]